MTTTYATAPHPHRPRSSAPASLATVAASAATAAVAAAGHAAGISLDVGGAPIPVLGFGTLTAFFSLVGVVMAVVWPGSPGARAARSSAPPWCSPRCRSCPT